MSLLSRVLLLSVFLLCGSTAHAQAPAPAAPPAKLLRALERGVNLPIWFTYRGQAGIDPALWYPDAADWQQIKALGFGHVRVQFDPVYFRDPAKPGALQAAAMAELEKGLAAARATGLVVVLAAEPQGPEKSRLVKDDAGIEELAMFWRAFAGALKTTSPKRLVFELLNEPTDTDAARNRVLMQRLVQAVREVAPQHSIVVEGHGYAGVDELIAFEPLPQANLIYSFHFYEPGAFTHQGAFWSWPMFLKYKGLPYPSSPEAVAAAVAAAEDDAKPHITEYGVQRWDQVRIAAQMDRVRDWAKAKGVPVWCGEFGAARLGAPLADRRVWLSDVRLALEARGIGWTHFDYTGHFGLFSGNAGARQLDPLDAQALGLTSSTRSIP